jgi:hypothetical protein
VTVYPDAEVTVTRRAGLHTPYAEIADTGSSGAD